MQEFTAPIDGVYKLEVWGGQGRCSHGGGKGGYSVGYINLNYPNSLFVCVGAGTNYVDDTSYHYNGGGGSVYSGGGASHIATTDHGELYNYSEYRDEVAIVAGGGGGGERFAGGVGGGATGGDGGMTELDGTGYVTGMQTGIQSKGGSQSIGGSSGRYSTTEYGQDGTFGRGGHGYLTTGKDSGGGGGGGWYGGGGIGYVGGGGGGSGHINTTLITNGVTIAGDQTFPSPNGGTETGHGGNGYCIITWQQLP